MGEVVTTAAETKSAVLAALGAKAQQLEIALDEVTLTLAAADYHDAMQVLHKAPGCQFEQLIDLCGVDYSGYGGGAREGRRFAVVAHLLSTSCNQRLRVRVFCDDDSFPRMDSVTDIWSSAGWFEREAFDLFGIVFSGHEDLRRILTDYGFAGHPLRKDFPLTGHVEMRYDAERQRVVYEPVSIEPREITPRVIRESHYAEGAAAHNGGGA